MDLFINGQKADLSQEIPLQMTFTASDLASPAAVKNSFSQQITLPATATNDAIFGAIFRADHRTRLDGDNPAGGVNPLVRTPFAIYDTTGEIVESGYLKLDTITNKNGVRGYAVTLYGGLGSFFYTLSYDDEGEALSLGDLPLVSADPEDKTDYTINADTVAAAWARLRGNSTKPAKFDAVNFAPAYNGLPDGEFAADKAIGKPKYVGGESFKDGYATYNDYALYDLGEDFTEWQTKDLRSYLQRPVVSVRALVNGITRYAAARGFAVGLDLAWFNDRNPYFDKAWMTLPLLSTRKAPAKSGSFDIAGQGWLSNIYGYPDATIAVQYPELKDIANVIVKCTPLPCLTLKQQTTELRLSFNRYKGSATAPQPLGMVAFAQLQLLDATGNIVGYSPIQVYASSYILGDMPDKGSEVVKRAEIDGFKFERDGDVNETVHYSYLRKSEEMHDGRPLWVMATYNGEDEAPELQASGLNVVKATIAFAYRLIEIMDGYPRLFPGGQLCAYSTNGGLLELAAAGCVAGAPYSNGTFEYEVAQTVRSQVKITQDMLFADTSSPMEFLLSYTKTFGLHYLYDSARRRVQIVTRNTLYGNRPTLNIEDRIDRSKEIKATPLPMSAKWLSFAPGSTEGEFVEYYKQKYGREYGTQKVNTGYDFDANTTDVLKDADFNGGAEVRELSKYFNNVTRGTTQTPSPFLNGKASYTLYKDGDVEGDTKEFGELTPTAADTVVPYVAGLAGYDMIPKLQCHGADNSPTDGAGILLLHRGSIADVEGAAAAYARFRLTDDINEMYEMNDDTPCWNFSGMTPASDMPIFGRFEMAGATITRTMDLGLPAEIDIPLVTAGEDTTVYERCWAAYIADRYHVDTRTCTAYVNLRGLTPGPELLRNFYYFDGALWVLNKINNYALTTPATTQCEFVKVQRREAYAAGQLLDGTAELTIQLSTDGTDLYIQLSRPLKTGEDVVVMTRGSARMAWLNRTTNKRDYHKSKRRWHIPLFAFEVSESGKIVIPPPNGLSYNTYRWELETKPKGTFLHITKASRSKNFGYKVKGDMDKAVTFAVAVASGTLSSRREVSNRCYFESRAHVRDGVLTQEFAVTK